jgi:hypothetical protein
MVTAAGKFRLVDINNIFPVAFDGSVYLDEKNYFVADKSIEVLFLIQEKVAGLPVDGKEAQFWKNQSQD